MSILSWILSGAIVGWVANMITNSKTGILRSVLIGMMGSIIGGAVVNFFTIRNLDSTKAFTDFTLTSLIVSIIGAVVFLLIINALRGTVNNSGRRPHKYFE